MNTSNQTNSLVYKKTKVGEKETIYLTIRLNDECKNGHQDFAITADVYQTGKPKIDKYHLMGGCCHDEILKAFPEFKIFVDLHLCDYLGRPTYAVENGYYHLKEGFNKIKPSNEKFMAEFCEYYRLKPEQFESLQKSRCKTEYALLLVSLGILDQWKEQANKAISLLENLTEKKFLVDSVKSQYNAPTQKEVEDFNKKVEEGYYTKEAEQSRIEAAKQGEIDKLIAKLQKDISNLEAEFNIQSQLISLGGSRFKDGVIFYAHSQKVKINWRGGTTLTDGEIAQIKENLVLPKGVTYEN